MAFLHNIICVYILFAEITSQNIEPGSPSTMKWSNESTCLLINLVEKYDDEFQNQIKHVVWKKITGILNTTNDTNFTPIQVDTKWKGLKRTYHEVKKHNSTSGNNIRKWIFFDQINNFLFKKPEINPPATCSSSGGLICRSQDIGNSLSGTNDGQMKRSREENPQYASSFMKKRKTEIDKRHTDKMERADRYLNLFERLVTSIEKKECP